MSDVRCVLDAKAGLAESPVWSAEEQALYWVDILAPALYRLDIATGATRSWEMPAAIGSFGLRERGGAVVALRTGLYLLDFDSGRLALLVADPEADQPDTRFNDGKVAPDGSFWVGTMDETAYTRPLGALYRLDQEHRLHRVLDGLAISNGLAWSADAGTMYHADTTAPGIWTYRYDPTAGTVSHRILLAAPDPEIGLPDGGATDIEGYYWSAGVTAGVLNRWSPDGRLDRRIQLPCARPTCPCFGGPDMKTLFITSLRAELTPEEIIQSPLSGGIFAVEVDVPGVIVGRYRG